MRTCSCFAPAFFHQESSIAAFMLEAMAYYLGLDAGATKTECALADGDSILARASAGSIKTMHTSVANAEKNLNEVLQSVSERARVSLDSISCTCIGLAGISVPRIAQWTRQALEERISGDVLLAGDEEVALDAAFRGGAGVLVVAGTGSNTIGRSSAGKIIHVGGWGPVIADEGSGNWIGWQAVRAIFVALDRGETTLLLERVLEYWGLADIGGLIDRANQSPGPNFSKLTPIVAECAEQKDPYARHVLERAGEALGMYAVLASKRLRESGREEDANPEIAFTGSILRHLPAVKQQMLATIARELPQAGVQTEPVDSVEGAIWRARRHSFAGEEPRQKF